MEQSYLTQWWDMTCRIKSSQNGYEINVILMTLKVLFFLTQTHFKYYKGLEVLLQQEQFEEYGRDNHIGAMTSWLIGSGPFDCPSSPVRAKVLQVTRLLWLPRHGQLSRQDPILKHYASPLTANK